MGRIPLPDVHKIRIICSLFNKFLRNFTSLSGNKFPTQYIQIKLILGSNFYDKMQLYGILGQPSYTDQNTQEFTIDTNPHTTNTKTVLNELSHE